MCARLAILIVLGTACQLTGPREASPEAIARSFEPYRARRIGAEEAESFLRRRTATLISIGETSGGMGSAAALTTDGYFLTVAHALSSGPTRVLVDSGSERSWGHAREIWTDPERDFALIHAELRTEDCFELAPERALAAGEVLLSYSHEMGGAAGRLEQAVDLPALRPYVSLAIPHDTPLRGGHSGGPAVLLDGRLLGVEQSTGMDTIFKRRSMLVHVSAAELERRIAQDREARGKR